jgi:hypothetical protein
MRLYELDKMKFNHAKEFLQDIDQGRGRIKEFISEYPWLVEHCRKKAIEELGNEISVYRGVTLYKPLRKEAIVSTTLDWQVAYGIIDSSPGVIFSHNETIVTKKALLRYKISPNDIMIWIDAALPFVKAAIGKRENYRIENRYSELVRIRSVLEFLDKNPEREIIANVGQLSPRVLEFESHMDGRTKMAMFREFMDGKKSKELTPEMEIEFRNFLE